MILSWYDMVLSLIYNSFVKRQLIRVLEETDGWIESVF